MGELLSEIIVNVEHLINGHIFYNMGIVSFVVYLFTIVCNMYYIMCTYTSIYRTLSRAYDMRSPKT